MTNSSGLHLVVGGFPELASALESTGLFDATIRTESTGSLRELIKNRAFPRDQAKVVFLFASSLPVDTSENLEYLVGRLSTAGWRVVVLGTSPAGRDIVDRHPSAGYLDAPFTVNQVLGALAGLGMSGIEPKADGHAAVPFGQTQARTVASEGPTTPQASQIPQETPQPSSPGAWTRPAPQQNSTTPRAAVPQPPPVNRPTPTDTTPKRPTPSQPAPEQPRPTSTPAGPWAQKDQTPAASNHSAQPVAAPLKATVQPVRTLARPTQDTSTAMARPTTNGPIGRRVGTYQDFAPSGPSARRRGHVITVTSPKGGTGKSSLSANLAVYLGLSLRSTGRRVALIDANFQQADTGKLLNVYTPNISNILKDEGSLTPERIEQYMIDRRDLNASFLLGPATPRDATPSFFNSRLYGQVLTVLKQNFDYILIDTPVAELYHDILRGFALPAADYIVVPITPAIHTLMNADSWLRTITQPRHQGGDEIDPNKIGVVLNQAQDGVECDEDEVRRELYSWNFIGSVPMTKEWLRANNTGEFIATKPIPEISEAFANILYAATGEELLLQGFDTAQTGSKRGLLSKLRRRK